MGTFSAKVQNYDFLAVKINENYTVLRCEDVCKNVLNRKYEGFCCEKVLLLSFSQQRWLLLCLCLLTRKTLSSSSARHDEAAILLLNMKTAK